MSGGPQPDDGTAPWEDLRVIGVVGGVASGKSVVAETLGQLGAACFDADRAGHDALADPDVIAAVRARWGDAAAPQGRVDRQAVARIVFAPDAESELDYLEQITHPKIKQRLWERAAEAVAAGAPALVLDAALLLEAGWSSICDVVLFVDAPLALRQQRAAARGWDADEVQRREARQWPLARKRSASQHVIDNSGDAAATRRRVAELWPRLLSDGPAE